MRQRAGKRMCRRSEGSQIEMLGLIALAMDTFALHLTDGVVARLAA